MRMLTLKMEAAKQLLNEAGFAVVPIETDAEWAVGMHSDYEFPGVYVQLTPNECKEVAGQIFDIKDVPQDQRR